MVTWENYEEYIMMHADRELTDAEEQELMTFINSHPELKRELAVYEQTRMTPDMQQVYTDKESLVQQQKAVKKIIAFPQWTRYAVAAGVAAVIFISVNQLNKTQTILPVAISTDTPANDVKQPATNLPAQQAPIKEFAAVEPVKKDPKTKEVTKKTTTHAHYNTMHDQQQSAQVAHVQPKASSPVYESINKLPVNNIHKLPGTTTNAIAYLPDNEVPSLVLPAESTKNSESLLDRLPLEDIKKQGMESVASAISNTYQQVNSIKHSITETTLSIKIEKRKLVLSF